MSNQPPRVNLGRRLLGARGAPNLTLGFTTKPSPRAPWARGYYQRSGNGGPQTCLPAARGMAKQQAVRAIFTNKAPKTLARGQASRGRRCKTSSGVA